MRALPLNIGTIHFIGIGGIGMSGIAEVLHSLGYTVQGSDISESSNVERLRNMGISVLVGHQAEHPGPALSILHYGRLQWNAKPEILQRHQGLRIDQHDLERDRTQSKHKSFPLKKMQQPQ